MIPNPSDGVVGRVRDGLFRMRSAEIKRKRDITAIPEDEP